MQRVSFLTLTVTAASCSATALEQLVKALQPVCRSDSEYQRPRSLLALSEGTRQETPGVSFAGAPVQPDSVRIPEWMHKQQHPRVSLDMPAVMLAHCLLGSQRLLVTGNDHFWLCSHTLPGSAAGCDCDCLQTIAILSRASLQCVPEAKRGIALAGARAHSQAYDPGRKAVLVHSVGLSSWLGLWFLQALEILSRASLQCTRS